MTDYQEAMADALAKHPDCSYADWDNGMAFPLRLTIVVKLWRNKECRLAGDPPRYIVEGYPWRPNDAMRTVLAEGKEEEKP